MVKILESLAGLILLDYDLGLIKDKILPETEKGKTMNGWLLCWTEMLQSEMFLL